METFGKYSLIRKIGAGGMAEVYLARTTVAQGLAKDLVIKTILPGYGKNRHFVSMFIDEAKIALGLNHPNIAQVFDFGAVGDTYYLAMEQVEGLDLLALLQEAAKAKLRLPYGISAYIVQQICKGLDYAHRKADDFGQPLGIVHRDISPQNILLSWDGAVKIVDFGIARARHVHEEEGVIKGKFAYMSPEQARGEAVDCRSDVFAAGIVLFEMVCARPLFHGKGRESLELVKAATIPPPRDYAPELPESLERIMLKALSQQRATRYATARDLQHDLGRFQLEWAQKTGAIVDSGALAQYLAQIIPAEVRTVRSLRPPTEASDGAHSLTPALLRSAAGTAAGMPMAPPSSPGTMSEEPTRAEGLDTLRPRARETQRERRYVYVLEGVLRNVPPLRAARGLDGAAALLEDLLHVVRDVAFKHDAILHAPSSRALARADASSLRLVVGLPVASEDDAGRALRLALALLDTVDGIATDLDPPLQISLAIQRGVAVVTRDRDGRPSAANLELELEGATATFAERLARSAHGGDVLVGGRVYRAARADWIFEELAAVDLPADEQIAIPGMTGADDDTDPGIRRARVYRLCGPKDRAQRLQGQRIDHRRLHGRELQLKALRDSFRDVLIGRKQRQVLIVGDPGVGKRTLVRTFLEGVSTREAYVVRTAARVGTALTPFGVIADLARDALGLDESASPHEVERRLLVAAEQMFPGVRSPELTSSLQALGRLLGAGELGAPEQDASARRAALIQILLRIEHRLPPDKPLLILCEDVHWADQDSQELFAEMLNVTTSRPVLGVMTTRPEPRMLRLAKELRMQPIFLEELPDEHRRQLLRERFAPDQDIEPLADQIFARAGGNPFFVNEILDSLLERGIVAEQGEDSEHPHLLRWVRRDAPIAVPSTIEDLLIARIDRLAPPKKETLLHAAVLGRNVSAGMLAVLLGRPVRLELDELVRHGFLATRDGEYRFKSDMTMTVAYGLLPAEIRADAHRTVAARIAGAAGYRAGQDDALIARHLELAGDSGASADRYLLAAQHAIGLDGNTDAFRLLTRALRLWPETAHARRFEAHRLREELLRRIAKRAPQLRELHTMRREAELLGDLDKQAQACCLLAQFYIDVGKAPAAARVVGAALELAQRAGNRLTEAEAWRLRSALARLLGDAEESLRLADQALALCDEVAAKTTPPPAASLVTRATISMSRGSTLWSIGRLEPCLHAYAEALVIYRALAMPRQEARVLSSMGMVFGALGEYEEALAHGKSALKIDQDMGDRSELALKLANIGHCYADLGDLGRAESYLGKALKLAQHTEDLTAAADATVSLGQLRLRQGRLEDAQQLCERGLELATASRDRYQEVRALQYLALARLGAERADSALELARSSVDLSRAMPMSVGILHGLTFEALALARLGLLEEALVASAEAAELLDAMARPEGAEHLWCWRAEVLRAAGQHEAAEQALSRAVREVKEKAARIHDPGLRHTYLASRPPGLVTTG